MFSMLQVKKVPTDSIVPEVKLYVDVNSFMVCVNDSFRLENERNQFSSNEKRGKNRELK